MSKEVAVKKQNNTLNTSFMNNYGNYAKTVFENSKVVLPKDYNVNNALIGAELRLKELGVLNGKVSKDSIVQALFKMLTQGLDVQKTQGYFINYGGTLSFQPSYFGNKIIAKRHGAEKIYKSVVYQDDLFEVKKNIENGYTEVVNHETKFGNQDGNIIGAYCIILDKDGNKHTTIMTKKQIDASWAKSKNPAMQKQFPEAMTERTVINKATKDFRFAMLEEETYAVEDEDLLEGADTNEIERLQADFEVINDEVEDTPTVEIDFEDIDELPQNHIDIDEDGVINEDPEF